MSSSLPQNEKAWKAQLDPTQYDILRNKGTESPFSGKYHDHKDKGVYTCAGCGQVLFSSKDKFDSGSGWPSFYQPAAGDVVKKQPDTSYGMERTEVLCSRCGGHLGHVFALGPDPTGLRYCINSAVLDFKKEEEKELVDNHPSAT